MHEHVVGEAVARVEALEVEQAERLEVDRRVARLGVGDVPVARGDLGQERKSGVAEVAGARDQLPRLPREEPVRLGVVALAGGDCVYEGLEVAGIHLAVGGHDGGDVVAVVGGTSITGDDRGADPCVLLVTDDLDALIRPVRPLGGAVMRGVVDDEDRVDEVGDALQHPLDLRLLVVGRDDERDPFPLVHASSIGTTARWLNLFYSSRGRISAGRRLPQSRKAPPGRAVATVTAYKRNPVANAASASTPKRPRKA